jgi:hypothetical protein
MELKKHNLELADRIILLDRPSDTQLARELMELHETKCRTCQEDRLSCTVRPACKNRNFLNTLIELGVQAEDLPNFCYSVYLDQIRRYILEGKGRGMIDRRIPIKDLLATLKVSSIRHFNSRFKKDWKNFSSASNQDQMLVSGDGVVFHFNFVRGIVVLNPDNEPLNQFDVFNLYVDVLSQSTGIPVRVRYITTNWWELSIVLDGHITGEKVGSIKDSIPQSFSNFQAVSTGNSTEIHLEVIVDSKNDPLLVADLDSVFKAVKKVPPTE